MSNYYTMQDAKVRIAHELMSRGWNVQGYHANESDSQQDIFSPAYWNGIATKNGYILVVDNSTGAEAKEIKKYNPKGNLSFEDRNKIEKLEAMTIERGCTAGEEENAKTLIEKIQAKISTESAYEVIGMSLAHMGNPSTSKWHIEKDGKIYDKGTGLTKYADLPEEYMYDINKMEFKSSYEYTYEYEWINGERETKRTERTISDETKKVINEFKSLILKFERIINNMNGCGDGTKETEKAGAEQQQKEGYEKVIKTEYKKEIKVNEVLKPENIIEGMYFILKTSFNNGCSKGNVYKINSVKQNPYNNKYYIDANRLNGKLNKTLTGRATSANSFDIELDKLINWIDKNSIAICELVEVNTPYEVEKWEKINKTAKTNINKKAFKETKATECPTTEDKQETADNTPEANKIDYTITEDVDTRDNSALWVVKIVNTLSREDYIKISEKLKTLKGYYSKFKHGFIFKYNPSEALRGCITESHITATEQEQKPNKAQETADSIINMSTEIITEMKLAYDEYSSNDEYKNKISDYIKKYNITITDSIINCIEFDGLRNTLQLIRKESEQKQQQEKQQAEKTVLIEKIDKNIESLQSKIDLLSGDYKTNTYKRMREDESRQTKIDSYNINIKILEYVKTKLVDNETITALEKALTVGAFRGEINSYYNRKHGQYPQEIEFPRIKYDIPLDGWYNKEVPQAQKKLQKYGITDTIELIKAVEEYKIIYNSCKKYTSPVEQQIKNLTNKYKMQQKGDINFTPKEVVNRLVEYAQIDNNSIVLEPSAGIGNIADQIKTITEHVECIEFSYSFTELLKLKNHKVVGSDTMQYNRFNYYDAVIMNPPFSEEIDHIQHAYKTLKAGGKLISITSPSWTFNNNRKAQEFREWFKNVGGEILEELESGTFEMTGVRTLIISIDKEEETKQEAI